MSLLLHLYVAFVATQMLLRKIVTAVKPYDKAEMRSKCGKNTQAPRHRLKCLGAYYYYFRHRTLKISLVLRFRF